MNSHMPKWIMNVPNRNKFGFCFVTVVKAINEGPEKQESKWFIGKYPNPRNFPVALDRYPSKLFRAETLKCVFDAVKGEGDVVALCCQNNGLVCLLHLVPSEVTSAEQYQKNLKAVGKELVESGDLPRVIVNREGTILHVPDNAKQFLEVSVGASETSPRKKPMHGSQQGYRNNHGAINPGKGDGMSYFGSATKGVMSKIRPPKKHKKKDQTTAELGSKS